MSKLRTLYFVDGENLALRYKCMLNEGRQPLQGVTYREDFLIWTDLLPGSSIMDLRRISYYTSAVGDVDHIRQIESEISSVEYKSSTDVVSSPIRLLYTTRSSRLFPVVKKRSGKSRKESICDIQLTVDVLRACYRDQADAVCILTGDGDFISLFQEVIHAGKILSVGAFSSGLCPDIPFVVDDFFLLDELFFEPREE